MDWKFFARTHNHDGNTGDSRLTNPKFGADVNNCLEVLPTGQAIQRGSSAMWTDINSPFATGKLPAANYPDWTVISAPFFGYQFQVNDSIQITAFEIPHGWAEGTPIELHIHMITNGTDPEYDRYVKHKIQLVWANATTSGVNGTTFSSSQSVTLTALVKIPKGTPDKSHLVTSVGWVSMVDAKVGAYVACYYTRIADGTGYPVANDPWILSIGAHYQVNSLGSITTYNKGL